MTNAGHKSSSKVVRTVLGSALTRRRRELGDSYARAGRAVNSSGQSVANWERGCLPLREKLPALAAYLGKSLRAVVAMRRRDERGEK